MNNIKRYLALAIVFSLLLGVTPVISPNYFVIEADKDKDKDDDEDDKEKEPELTKKQEAEKSYAQELGTQYGELYAIRDFARGLKAKNTRHFNTKSKFNKYFGREKSSDSFFYNEFKKAFKEQYDAKSAELSASSIKNGELEWFEIVKTHAIVEGQMAAYHDFTMEKEKDWEKAYKDLVKDGAVFSKFHLSNFDKKVEKDFKDEFKTMFRYEYDKAYLVALEREASVNTNYEYINTEAKTLSIFKPYYQTTQGAVSEINTPIQNVEVVFSEGSVYDNAPLGTPMALRLNEHSYMFHKKPSYLLPQTDVFELDLQRGIDEVDFYNSPVIKFSGHANLPQSTSIGIYKWKDKKWKYIPTMRNQKDNFISAKIGEGKYHDTKYAVFFDKTYKMPNDIALNWAMDALDVAVRRHHVKYEVKLRPNDRITRAELADIVYRTLSYRQGTSSRKAKPIDIDRANENAIMYCINKGYLTKSSDGKFNPNMTVNYEHFKILMNRIYGSKFKMSEFAQKMREKGHESDYVKGANPNITRAEVIFAFYTYSD